MDLYSTMSRKVSIGSLEPYLICFVDPMVPKLKRIPSLSWPCEALQTRNGWSLLNLDPKVGCLSLI